jgi:riboflavin kinase / FMN adenylyltransferase
VQVSRLDSLEPRAWPHAAVTVGNFDGVHRGHQALVDAVVRAARQAGGTAVALTFDPHPSRVLSPDRAPASLMTLAQKAEVLASLGIDQVAALPFTGETAAEPPEEFARGVLRGALGAEAVVVGTNFRFGKGRAGDLAVLDGLGKALGFRVDGIPPVVHEGAPISSTRIREALSRGAVAAAAELLGRPYFVDGVVGRGDGRGRTLGIPTANLDPINEILPARGVYVGQVRVADGAVRGAVVNIGRRPTFGGTRTLLEAHLLDFDGDLYGRTLRLGFLERLREERTFPGPQALVEQIHDDVARARALLVNP